LGEVEKMISGVKIKNFKSIGEEVLSLELKPITLLVGPNGSGKSSIIQAIAFVAQNGKTKGEMFEAPVNDVFHRQQEKGTMSVAVMFDKDGYEFSAQFAEGMHQGTSTSEVGTEPHGQRKFAHEVRNKFFVISSVRGNVPLEGSTGPEVKWVGANGERLLELLAIIFGQRRYENTAGQIASWAAQFGITGLKAGFWGQNRLNADYRDEILKTTLKLALASAGARQVLTMITQLFWSPPRSIIAVEEPEISLHPKAQIDISELFSEIIKQDKQIIAETHSSLLVLALVAAVQKQLIRAEDIAIYHVEKKRGSGTSAKRLPLSKQGRLRGWIPSFAKEERRLLQQWWKTLPEG